MIKILFKMILLSNLELQIIMEITIKEVDKEFYKDQPTLK